MSRAVSTTGVLVKRRRLPAIASVAITSSSAANPSVITTPTAHGLVTGETATIAGHTGSTPSINADHVVTVTSPTTFTIPINVTVAGTGGTVALSTTGVANLTTVAEIVRATPPGFSRNKIETSTHNEGTESYILGLLRQRDPNFMVNYVADETTHEQILDDIMGNLKAFWRFDLPSGVTAGGDARVQQFMPVDAPVDAAQQAEVTLSWAGPVTWTTP